MNIVIDANALAFYLLNHPDFTAPIENVIEREVVSLRAPSLWRSELQSVLMEYVQYDGSDVPGRDLTLDEAIEHMSDADLLVNSIPLTGSEPILRLAYSSGCSTYDCQYVHLADTTGTQVLTWDKQMLNNFPQVAFTPEDFAAQLDAGEEGE
jgi:predicted nucleic acid-binding protein